MITRTDKTQGHRGEAVANNRYKRQAGIESSFRVVNNRPEAIAQRKLQEIADKSPQAKKSARLQRVADSYATRQRHAVQKNGHTHRLPSASSPALANRSGNSSDNMNANYNSGEPAKLKAYSDTQGTDTRPNPSLEHGANVVEQRSIQPTNPTPASIQLTRSTSTYSGVVYQRALDLSTLATTRNHLYYTVFGGGEKLISEAAAPAPEPRALYNEQDKTAINGRKLTVWKPRSQLADKKKLKGETPVYRETGVLITDLIELEDTVLAQIMEQVRAEVNDREGDRGLRLGTAGMNDCKGFATTLRSMIAKYGENPNGLVGKSWLHPTDPHRASFPYHGATVVAQDSGDAVTLEAHAGQDLTAPKFHIRRGGKIGFESANKQSHPGQYTDTAAESPIQQIDEAEVVINMLKQAWTDVNVRSDKSAVYESSELPATFNTRNWLGIGLLLSLLVVALIKLNK